MATAIKEATGAKYVVEDVSYCRIDGQQYKHDLYTVSMYHHHLEAIKLAKDPEETLFLTVLK